MSLREQELLLQHMKRCRSDPRYCYASHFRVVSELGSTVGFGELYPAPKQLQDWYDECLNTGRPARAIVLKARRHRISTWAQAAIHHSLLFNRNRNAVVCAHDEDTSKLIFRMQETFYNNLPDYLRPMKRRASVNELVFDNPSESGRITNPGLNSRVQIRTAGARVGRRESVKEAQAWGGAIELTCSMPRKWPFGRTGMMFFVVSLRPYPKRPVR